MTEPNFPPSLSRCLGVLLENSEFNYLVWTVRVGRESKFLATREEVINLIHALREVDDVKTTVEQILDMWFEDFEDSTVFVHTPGVLALLYALRVLDEAACRDVATNFAESKMKEIGNIRNYARELLAEIKNAELTRTFESLVASWHKDTLYVSSLDVLFEHPAYQKIITLGPAVVPLILTALANNPDHWGFALRAITGQDPVPTSAAGKLDAIADAWLAWGKERGIIQ